MDEHTNQVFEEPKKFSLSEMSAVMMDRKNIPVGFFVSQALWTSLSERLKVEQGFGLGSAPFDFHGTRVAVDPSLPDTEFDAAFTEEAWRKRLASIPH